MMRRLLLRAARRLGLVGAVLLVAVLTVGVGACTGRHFLWNLSASLPRGLYLLEPSRVPRRGAIVAFEPPPPAAAEVAARRYLPEGASLLKIVAALPGDRVCLHESAFVVNGELVGPIVRQDSAGRPLTPFDFCGPVPAGRAFVATTAPLSYDSRYFGPVALASLTVAVPAWTY
jgi:conjugative transfer signal peptidase TraF